jgi:sialic acid synthase SpsE
MLRKAAEKHKPMIISTGMGDMKEIKEAVKTITKINKDIILMHCTSNYPTKLEDVNLRAMLTLKEKFSLLVGYSDHTLSTDVPMIAVLLGASVIEKHFTYDKNAAGPDHKASLSSAELKEMITKIREIECLSTNKKNDVLKSIKDLEKILGKPIKKPNIEEKEISKLVRKSIVAKQDVNRFTVITEDMLALKRPGTGLNSKDIRKIIGKVAKKDIKKDELISWNMIK